MNHLRVAPSARLEAEFAENLSHGGVFRKDFGDQFLQPGLARNDGEVAHQQRADALALIVIDDDKGDLGLAGVGDDVTPPADDDATSVLFGEHDERDVIYEVDVHEEGDLLLREATLHHEETAVQRLHAGTSDGCKHVILVVWPKCADFDRAAVAQAFGNGVIFRRRH